MKTISVTFYEYPKNIPDEDCDCMDYLVYNKNANELELSCWLCEPNGFVPSKGGNMPMNVTHYTSLSELKKQLKNE